MTLFLVGLSVACGIGSVSAWAAAADRLSSVGRQRRESTEFLVEYRIWYLEPSSFKNGGYVYSVISVVCGLVAFGVVLYFVLHGIRQAA